MSHELKVWLTILIVVALGLIALAFILHPELLQGKGVPFAPDYNWGYSTYGETQS